MQGNPFGPAGGRWMPESELRRLFAADMSYDGIAEANFEATGWRPSRSGVLRKYRALGEPPRNANHEDLLPWRLAPEHADCVERHWLQAESRRRQGLELSRTDRMLIRGLNAALRGQRVVAYDTDSGFSLVRRLPTDMDIIRQPEPSARVRKR